MRLEKARFVLGQLAHGMIRPQKEINKAVDTVFSELDKRTWIPVTERLPEKEMLCLVSRNCTRPILLEQVEIDFWYIPKGQSLGYWLKSSSWNVTAWMPILEPYKEVNENE